MSSRTRETKRRLFNATIELLGQRGYDNTSVDDIVERAGMSKGTVYYHYHGKSDLVEALLQDRTGALVATFREIELGHDDPQEAIQEIVRAQLDFLGTEADYNQVLVNELWRVDRPWHLTLMRMRGELVETICRIVHRGVKSGVFRDDVDPDFAGYALFGLTTFCALDHNAYEPGRSFDDLREQILSTVWATLRTC